MAQDGGKGYATGAPTRTGLGENLQFKGVIQYWADIKSDQHETISNSANNVVQDIANAWVLERGMKLNKATLEWLVDAGNMGERDSRHLRI
jgi:hypothetical protein